MLNSKKHEKLLKVKNNTFGVVFEIRRDREKK